MKFWGTLFIIAALAVSTYARDTTLILPINSALKKGYAKGVITKKIRLQFGKRGLRSGQRKYTANRKTNGVGKSDREACEWAFLSSIRSLQDRARKRGKRSVTGIVSYYKKRTRSSSSKYECHAGAWSAGVALRGNI